MNIMSFLKTQHALLSLYVIRIKFGLMGQEKNVISGSHKK